jgi:NAD-dependent DNA ligase
MDNLRTTLNYDIDGLVVKGNEIDEEVMKRPKPAKQIAFKLVKISKNKKLKINF